MKYLSNVASLALDSEKCTGCGSCTEVCPHGVFEMRDGRVLITDKDRCMECGACARNCDAGALAVSAGVGCAAAIINSIVFGGEPSCDCSASSSKGCCG